MLALVIPIIVAVVGLLIYALGPARAQTPGIYAWAVGLLVALLHVGGRWSP